MTLWNVACRALVSYFLQSDLTCSCNNNGNNKRIECLSNDYSVFILFYYACAKSSKLSIIAIININFFARYLNFGKIRAKTNFAKFLKVFIKSRKFKYFVKIITYSKSPDYVLQSYISYVYILKVLIFRTPILEPLWSHFRAIKIFSKNLN